MISCNVIMLLFEIRMCIICHSYCCQLHSLFSLSLWPDLIRVSPPSSSSSASLCKGQIGPSTGHIVHCKWGAVGDIVRAQGIQLVGPSPPLLVGDPLVRSQNGRVTVPSSLGQGEGVLEKESAYVLHLK